MNKGKKALSAVLAAAMILSAAPLTASAAWNRDGNGSWNWTENGKKATGWLKVNEKWYNFDSNGTMKTGWMKDANGYWFFLEQSGAMKTGWLYQNAKWYYLKANGAMSTNWVKSGDKWYHMNASGAMETGFYKVGDKSYFAAANGEMQTGVVEIDGAIYYFGERNDGAMKTGDQKIGNITYKFGEDGKASGALKPKAAVAFTTSNNGTVVTPAEPSKPSSGGGGYTGGGSGTTDPTTPSKTDVTITKETVLNPAFFAKEYATVTVDIKGMANALDLSALKADKVVVNESKAARAATIASAPTFEIKFGANVKAIDVAAAVVIKAVENVTLPSVAITAKVSVELSAPAKTVTVSAADATVIASEKVETLVADKSVTISGTGVQTVEAKADVTLETNAHVATVSVPSSATEVKISGGIVDAIDANAKVVITDTAVTKLEAKADVEVAGTTSVETLNVAKDEIEIVAEGSSSITDLTKDASVTKDPTITDNSSATIPEKPTVKPSAQQPPKLTAIDETATTDGKGAISGITDKMEYRKLGDTKWTVIEAKDITEGKITLEVGSYQVRLAKTEVLAASDAVTVTIKEFVPELSSMLFASMTKEEYTAATKDMKNAPAYEATDVTTTTTADNKVNLTGTLPYVKGFTGFWEGNVQQQEGHYAAITLRLPIDKLKDVSDETVVLTFTSEGGNGTVKTVKKGELNKDGSLQLLYRVDGRMETPITFTVDFDGAANAFSAVKYTLDFSALTLEADPDTIATVESVEDLTKALANEKIAVIKLGSEFTSKDVINITRGVTIDGQNKTIDCGIFVSNNNVEIKNLVINITDNKKAAKDGNEAVYGIYAGSFTDTDISNVKVTVAKEAQAEGENTAGICLHSGTVINSIVNVPKAEKAGSSYGITPTTSGVTMKDCTVSEATFGLVIQCSKDAATVPSFEGKNSFTGARANVAVLDNEFTYDGSQDLTPRYEALFKALGEAGQTEMKAFAGAGWIERDFKAVNGKWAEVIDAQKFEVRGQGPAVGESGEKYDYAKGYADVGAALDTNSGTITYTKKAEAIPTQLVNGDKAYMGVKFPKPDGANSVTVNGYGSNPIELSLATDSANSGADVFEGECILYIPFAKADGDALGTGTRNITFTFTWAKESEFLGKTTATIVFPGATVAE